MHKNWQFTFDEDIAAGRRIFYLDEGLPEGDYKLGRYMPVFDGLFMVDWIRVLLEEMEADA